jgi:lysozyme
MEILVLKSPLKEDLITVLQQYNNAKGFQFAPADKKIPKGKRTEVVSKAQDIPKAANPPALERKLLIFGVSDADPGVTGADVKEMQQRLMDLGYYEGEINGIFDRATDVAVKDFQTKVFGVSEADGKVGKITWNKLFGTTDGAAAPKPEVSGDSFAKGSNFLRLTKTAQKDAHGLVKLKLEYFKDGKAIDSLLCISGQARAQFFRTGKDSKRGSFEPVPEGKWTLSDLKWADGKDVYNRSVWSDGLGPVKIFMDYVPVSGTRRANIEIHLDWNKNRFPGTAGCIGINTIADFKQLVGWLRDTDPKELYVDWGLGSVKLPK